MCQEEELWPELHVPEKCGEPAHIGRGDELRVQPGEAAGDEAEGEHQLLPLHQGLLGDQLQPPKARDVQHNGLGQKAFNAASQFASDGQQLKQQKRQQRRHQ